MRKVDRLFSIIQLLRGRRLRTAEFLAEELGVSVRTIYRDIQALVASGVPIEGERGVGYLAVQPIEMPPLHFTALELRAIQLGMDFVSKVADDEMAAAAVEVTHKVADALPVASRGNVPRFAGELHIPTEEEVRRHLKFLRGAIDDRQVIDLDYRSGDGALSSRTVRPLQLDFWGNRWTVTGWCELREDFRTFRLDRFADVREAGRIFMPEKGKRHEDYLARIEAQINAWLAPPSSQN